jgi:hypothetical protein
MLMANMKRKNDEPIPRRYWWIFGTLAILLLIGLRYPIRLWTWYELNFLFYLLIGVAFSIALVRFIRRFHWRHGVAILILTCVVLTGLSIKNMGGVYTPVYEPSCTTEDNGIFIVHTCDSCPYMMAAKYVGLRGLPVVVQIDSVVMLCWW